MAFEHIRDGRRWWPSPASPERYRYSTAVESSSLIRRAPGANQPYHFVEKLELGAAEKHLASCAAVSGQLALAAIRDVIQELNGYEIAGAAILLASGRPLPSLPKILASHALIHTAEGEFFRQAVRQACKRLRICVTGIRERELGEGSALQQEIANVGKIVGPPWTQDQKIATLAAMIILMGEN